MFRVSLIVNVLESYEVVQRQLRHLQRILTPACELVLVDDGSEPTLQRTCDSVPKTFAFRLLCTHDQRPWTQPRARNLGARAARADTLLFFDIDHIITRDLLATCLEYQGDKLHWARTPAILDERGEIVTDPRVLTEYGLINAIPSVHVNSFLIRRGLFERLAGYDERFCGRYGGDDIDFNARYEALCHAGLARPAEIRGLGHVFPDPARDVKGLFHSLARAS